jgi:aryl-alcohol dehydrogenase
MSARAAVVEHPGAPFVLSDVELDGPRPGEVIVGVRAVGICHTDLVFADRGNWLHPAILGHEAAGVVQQVGADVTTLSIGDHVVASFAFCDRCGPCASGHPANCDDALVENMGGARRDGSRPVRRIATGDTPASNFFGQSSFATHAVCHERHLVRVPRDVPFEVLAPLACGVQTGVGTVERVLATRPGSAFAVFGAGAVGLGALCAAVALRAAPVIVVEPNPARRQLALELGAAHVVDPLDADVVTEVRALAPGGVATALDTTGRADVVAAAFACLTARGTVAVVGTPDPAARVTVPLVEVLLGKRMIGVIEGDAVPSQSIPHMIELWKQGHLPIETFIRTYPLDEIDRAVRDARSGDVVMPVLVPAVTTTSVTTTSERQRP